MVKLICLLMGYALLLFPAISGGSQTVDLRFLPFHTPANIPVGYAIWLFAAYGSAVVALVGLIDRAQLAGRNRSLKKDLEKTRGELERLRHMITLDRGESGEKETA